MFRPLFVMQLRLIGTGKNSQKTDMYQIYSSLGFNRNYMNLSVNCNPSLIALSFQLVELYVFYVQINKYCNTLV